MLKKDADQGLHLRDVDQDLKEKNNEQRRRILKMKMTVTKMKLRGAMHDPRTKYASIASFQFGDFQSKQPPMLRSLKILEQRRDEAKCNEHLFLREDIPVSEEKYPVLQELLAMLWQSRSWLEALRADIDNFANVTNLFRSSEISGKHNHALTELHCLYDDISKYLQSVNTEEQTRIKAFYEGELGLVPALEENDADAIIEDLDRKLLTFEKKFKEICATLG
ncbi:hypothetical protein HZA45_01145 [Candidatus Peregrinibacteria bacterium]|nr:hypothetical protein [Candidatus Peregrinibacteria bacterium]